LVLSGSRFVNNTSFSKQNKKRGTNIREPHHFKILPTNTPFVSPPSRNVMERPRGGWTICASAMTYTSIRQAEVSLYERTAGESMCIWVGEYSDYFCGIITIESGIGEDRDRSLSFTHSFICLLETRIKQKKNTHRKINTKHLTTNTFLQHPKLGRNSLSISM
jgi:hypothetical protein